MSRALLLLVTWVCLHAGAARAEVRLPSHFSDHMVLQRGEQVPVWGWATPGEQVVVRLGGQTRRATTGRDGRWSVRLGPLRAGGPLRLTVSGDNTITLRDVLVGEVWLCSGQSNMAWPVGRARRPFLAITSARALSKIRLLTVKRRPASRPQGDPEGRWQVCGPRTVKAFSALAFFFGRKLHRRIKVPVGLINSSYSATPIEAWISRGALEREPAARPLLDHWGRRIASYNPRREERLYRERLAAWRARVAKLAPGTRRPRRPSRWADPRRDPRRPSSLYNAMVAPLVPFAVRGVIWYQGESNVPRAYQYRSLFPRLIADWRRAWSRELPFYLVQLPNLLDRTDRPTGSAWAELREAQLLTHNKVPGTGMAVTIDIGKGNNIHPKNKREVARRLLLWALVRHYGGKLAPSGPVFRSMRTKANKTTLRFDHVHGGLAARSGGPLRGFAVAGADRVFSWARAEIAHGKEVIVWSPKVPRPIAVRYGWADNPVCNLVNKAGLPASPFRTDDWPGQTVGKKY